MVEVKRLRKKIKLAAKRDRAVWLDNIAASGDWSKLKILRKGIVKKKGRLRNMEG